MWKDLTMQQRAELMDIYLGHGITSLDDMRRDYDLRSSDTANTYREGGSIHISPSKKGTFTAAATKHGMGVQEFASKVLAHPENYSPAMRKKANFARNASKWHGLGGNLYDDGGLTDQQYYSIMEKVAEENNPKWNKFRIEEGGRPLSVDEDYMRILNDNSYDYRGYYNKYPNSAANADTHWNDEFKTAWHPSFSDLSIYSGRKSQYNPKGIVGGHWYGKNEDIFIPTIPQLVEQNKSYFGLGGHIYDGLTENSQQMDNSYSYIKPLSEVIVDNEGNVRDPEVPSARGTIQLPEVTVNTPDLKDMVGRYSIASNDAITVANGRPVNMHLKKAFDEGAKKQAAWDKEHPWLETAGLIAGAAPFAVAAAPAVVGGGELAATALANPYVDAALTSMGGAHAAQSLANGEANWMTALELAPLGRLTKPLYEGVVQPGMRLFNSPVTGNWTKIGNREYRLSPNSFGANGSPIESRGIAPQITAENAAENGMGSSIGSINVEHSLDNISRFEGSSPIPTGHQGMVGYRPKQRTAVWDSAKQDMVPLKSIDEVPNLRKTIDSILRRIKTEDIRPEFLNENAYVNAFRDNATRQGININDLSHEDIAKILTEQYNQLREGSSGILRDNILWRTWGRTIPPNEFNWQEHLGEFTQNKGFWGEGNYFGTGVYGSSIANQPYMINDITAVGYDDLLGATAKAGDAIREGKNVGSQLATGWMSESPSTRIVAATENGARNRYGWLDTGDQGIEIVTQKNTGIKALNPDLTIGNGETFPRDWSNPDAFKGLLPLLGLGAAGTLYGKQE